MTLTYNDATSDCRCTTFRRWFSDAEIEAALREAGFGIEVSAPWSRFVKDDRVITWYVATRRRNPT